MGNRSDDHMETHRAQGKQEPVKEAESKAMTDSLRQQAESKVMDDSLRPQVPLAPCQAAVHIGAIEQRLMAARAVRHLRACLTQAAADPISAMRSAGDIILMWRIDVAFLKEEASPTDAAMMPAISGTAMTVEPQHSQSPLEVAAELGKKAADLSSATNTHKLTEQVAASHEACGNGESQILSCWPSCTSQQRDHQRNSRVCSSSCASLTPEQQARIEANRREALARRAERAAKNNARPRIAQSSLQFRKLKI